MSTARDVVEFCGPPPVAETKHGRISRVLRDRPAEWAVVQRAGSIARAASAAQAIRSAKLLAYGPAGAFEAVARTVEGEHRVYARYVGAPARNAAGGVAA
ncbi:hypothetical protein ABZW30_30140 [Kitasatospora sp. NPDC004669]|uniref:hypothetical protein n=1 Tax=Kitasatospora sp. NPDC004669 TaxID=3154555 RepID=UPI0033AAF732